MTIFAIGAVALVLLTLMLRRVSTRRLLTGDAILPGDQTAAGDDELDYDGGWGDARNIAEVADAGPLASGGDFGGGGSNGGWSDSGADGAADGGGDFGGD